MAKENATLEPRDGFTSKWGFILACIGSAVGMGNIWRFPILVSAYGGMTFLIPYFIFVILIGSTGIIEEMALGRSAAAGPVGAFGMCTELRTGNRKTGEAIGVIPILGSLALAIGYTCVMAWIFKYTFLSFSGGLYAMGQNMDTIGGTFGATASAWGANLWVIVAIVVSFAIMISEKVEPPAPTEAASEPSAETEPPTEEAKASSGVAEDSHEDAPSGDLPEDGGYREKP